MMTKFQIGRNAKNGKFMKVEDAKKRPTTTVVETIKKPSQAPKPVKKSKSK